MIQVMKSAVPPAVLLTEGAAETMRNCQAYDASPADYHAPTKGKKFTFDNEIYGHKTVKAQLRREQHEKCCFCEGSFSAHGFGDVEHFRPKAGFKQKAKDKLSKPGYYWLAYEWDNLFFSCQICNQQFKKNLFPLVPGATRAINHRSVPKVEAVADTLLINPALDDPEQHISFRQEVPFGKTDKGEESIKTYGLIRESLNEARRKHLEVIRGNFVLARIRIEQLDEEQIATIRNELGGVSLQELRRIIEVAKAFIASAAKSSALFAGMTRSNFSHLPRQ
jgi:uncharacterized protein (TIGR02646 family)